MRLIDADTLIKNLSYLYTKNHIPVDMRARGILSTVMEQPTAYDVDKVVEQLEKLKNQNPFINGIRDNSIEAAASRQTLDYAIEIVKAGVKYDD